MTADEKITEAGYEDVVIFGNPSYDDAFIGVSESNCAVYDYWKMVDWLMCKEGLSTVDEAVEWLEYNTIRALPYTENAPIIVYPL